MPKERNSGQIKDREKYEALREEGMSKEKAARISNAGDKASQKGGKQKKYEEWTKKELYDKAREVGIKNRSGMGKKELIDALRNH